MVADLNDVVCDDSKTDPSLHPFETSITATTREETRSWAISTPSGVRENHEEMQAVKCSRAETTVELVARFPTPSFYETPVRSLAAHAGRDPFPVGRSASNRNQPTSGFGVRHGAEARSGEPGQKVASACSNGAMD